MNIPFQQVNVAFGAPNITPFVIKAAQWRTMYVHTDGVFGYAVCMDYWTANFYVITVRFSDLQICIYSNVTQRQVNTLFDANTSYCRFLGNGLFLCYNGNGFTYYIQLPQVFIANGWVQVRPYVFSFPSPCGNGTLNASYYDANKKIMLQSYIKNYPLANDWWASVYATTVNGFNFLQGGYIGNFPSAINPLLQGTGAGGWSFFSSGYSGGTVAYYASTGEIFTLPTPSDLCRVFTVNDIQYGNLACGVPNNQTFVTNTESFNFQNVTASVGQCGLCTPWSNTYACLVGSGAYHGIVANPNIGVQINAAFASDLYGAFVTDNAVYHLYGQTTTVRVSASPNGSGVSLPPIVNTPKFDQLLNWHRPISTRGLFKT